MNNDFYEYCMTKWLLENNGKSYFIGFISGKLNYGKYMVGTLNIVMMHFCGFVGQRV